MEVGQSGGGLISEASAVEFDVSAASYGPPPPSQYTFLETYTSASQSERRGPRTRTAPPVPVPNLTKKSRGRRVPTKTAAEKEPVRSETPQPEGIQKTGRLYVCKVENCGKCFSRGEHLKRHVRSIHTHEKREWLYGRSSGHEIYLSGHPFSFQMFPSILRQIF
jgi:uncharacterized Zn-finger protein